MIKILHVCSGKGLGGTRTVFLAHQKLFEKLNLDATPLIRPKSQIKDQLSELSLQKLQEINYFRRFPIKLQKSAKLMKELATNNDLIWVHKPIDAYIWRTIAPASKIVMVVHGFQNTNLDCANYLVAVSCAVFKHLEKKGLNNIFLLNNFLNMSISDKDLKNNSKKITLSSFGFFRRKKGFTDLLKALSILQNRIDPKSYEVNIYGNGRLGPILRLMKFFLKLKNLKINQWTKQMKTCLNNTDIVVIPSRNESFSMVTIEAMSQGCLVVSTRCKGPELIITNNFDGILVEKNNPKALAYKLEEVINNFDKYKEIRQNGKETAATKFTIQASENSLNSIIEKITAN